MSADEVAAIADELYALRPEDFTAARNLRAKAAQDEGDKELAAQVRALRKPSAAAWLVNLLSRDLPDEVGQVLELGSALREAQAELDGAALRDLDRQRQRLVSAVVRQARALATDAGHPVGEPVAAAVEQTLRAAMADPDAADAVRSGRLVEPLASTGLGPVEVSGAIAVPSAPPTAGQPPRHAPAPGGPARDGKDTGAKAALADARRQVGQAEKGVADAAAGLTQAGEAVDRAESRRRQLAGELQDLKDRVRGVERDLSHAESALRDAERGRAQAEESADRAGRDLDQARRRVQRLE